jgi:hypothetical protein
MVQRTLLAVLLLIGLGTLALARQAPELLPADRPIQEIIDHYIDALLQEEKITTAPPASAATILRRLTLDLNGRIPTVQETNTYLANADPQKKLELVDQLLASPCYVRHQAQEFGTFLIAQSDLPPKKNAKKGSPLQSYLVRSFAENKPWDRVFREVMLPDDAVPEMDGASDFIRSRVKDLNRLTIDVSTVFFGVNVSCAQCHDHPHVHDWTQDQFYGMKSFFSRTFDAAGVISEYDSGLIKYVPNKGKEKVAPAMFLTGRTIEMPNLREPSKEEKKKAQSRIDEAKKAKKPLAPPEFSARAKLVDMALEPDQRHYFARAVVNRLWYRFFGRGLVMPLDQMHKANPASHPELLEWLARDLIDHGYDLKRLIRGMVLSNAYARSTRWEGETVPFEKYFAVGLVRPLTPMQMALSLKIAAADPETLTGERADLEKSFEKLDKIAEGFANVFAKPMAGFQVGVSEAMLFANNQALNKELFGDKETLVSRMMKVSDPKQRAELAVRAVLCRAAEAGELQVLTEYLGNREERPEAGCQQVVWALMASAEFRFNH